MKWWMRNYWEESANKIIDLRIINTCIVDDRLTDKMQRQEECCQSYHLHLKIIDRKTLNVGQGNVVMHHVLHELLIVVCFSETFHWVLHCWIMFFPSYLWDGRFGWPDSQKASLLMKRFATWGCGKYRLVNNLENMFWTLHFAAYMAHIKD